MTSTWFEDTGSGNVTSATDSDLSGDDENHQLLCKPTVKVIVPILYCLIAAVGLLANFLVVYIIVVLKEYQKTVTNVYIVQLATADFLFLSILPFEASQLVHGAWDFGDGWCKITKSIQMLNYYSSILFLTVMSVDRYLAINHAMNAKMARFRTKRAVGIISAVVWGLGLLSVVYLLIKARVVDCTCTIEFESTSIEDYSGDYSSDNSGDNSGDHSDEYSDDNSSSEISGYDNSYLDFEEALSNVRGACSFKGQYQLSLWLICNFVLAFILPLIVISACYYQIILRISKPMAVGSKSHKSNKTRKRITFMVTALVTVFIVCWLPYHSFNLARVNDSQLPLSVCDPITQFTLVFAYLSSALNPFLYTFLGTNFRKRWSDAVGRTRSFRPSFGSRSDYNQGQGRKSRRKSSRTSVTGHKGHDEDTLSNSNVTKNTVIPLNNLIVQRNEEDTAFLNTEQN